MVVRRPVLVAVAAILAIAVLGVAVACARLVAAQTPRTMYDTGTYQECAARPLALDALVLAKPPTMPLIVRAAGLEPAAVVHFQEGFAAVAWLALGASGWLVLRRRLVRGIATLVWCGLVLAPARLGFTGVVLSESVDDSLRALAIALLLLLGVRTRTAGRRDPVRWVIAALLAIVAVAWVFTRDTNAMIALVAVAVALGWWCRSVTQRAARSGVVVGAIVIAAAVLDLASARIAPARPLPFQTTWQPELTARAAFPTVNNLLVRGLADREARAFFAARGLPVAALEPFARPLHSADFVVASPERAEAHRWIAAHGTGAYVSWLLHAPLARTLQLVGNRDRIFAPDLAGYMPEGWVGPGDGPVVVAVVRRVIGSPWLFLLMAVATPAALWRARTDVRVRLAACLIAAGLVGVAASFYGDAMEIPRHCYGAVQQTWLGMAIALLAWLDRARMVTAAATSTPA